MTTPIYNYSPKLPPRTDRADDGSPEMPFCSSREIAYLLPRLIDHIGVLEIPIATVFDWSLLELEWVLADMRKEEYPATEELHTALCARLLREQIADRRCI